MTFDERFVLRRVVGFGVEDVLKRKREREREGESERERERERERREYWSVQGTSSSCGRPPVFKKTYLI